MSDHEGFAYIDQRKWAIMSESLRWLTKNEQMSESLIFFSKSHIRSFLGKKRAIRSENRWANSQPWKETWVRDLLPLNIVVVKYLPWPFDWQGQGFLNMFGRFCWILHMYIWDWMNCMDYSIVGTGCYCWIKMLALDISDEWDGWHWSFLLDGMVAFSVSPQLRMWQCQC